MTKLTDGGCVEQGFYIENKNVGNKATSEDWRSKISPSVYFNSIAF